ncbi:MAG: SDR family NAD(P)-dependent oxidoreductase [Candidatus Methylacidiphilales bacterium]|nr:SDR family NAD(P)-dependent oxidoreductase [Candidatus Methylacidiphilales bacterium]
MAKKVIALTGATRGCGRALVDFFAGEGHTVLGCGRDARALAALSEAHPTPHDFMAVDLREESSITRWAGQVLENYGPPDLLINNAAVINTSAPLWQVPGPEFEALIDINVNGMARVLRHFLPAMVARGRGVVVNFSSGWGRSAAPQVAPYCASKWAVEGLTAALAQELPAGMAAVALNPGIIDTDMLRSCFEDGAAAYPGPEDWVLAAGPFILKLGPRDNGRPATVPDVPAE